MQKLYLSIPDPCHENWQAMTATQQGRFCKSCEKEVIDFSMMTDTEVLNYFTTVSHEKVCGRTLPSQLERTIRYPKEPKKRLFWYWNYIVMFFMFFSKGTASKAQVKGQTIIVSNVGNTKEGYINDALKNQFIGCRSNTGPLLIKGKITDEDGQPVPFSSINILKSVKGLSADTSGKFLIRVDRNAILLISALGYEAQQVIVKDNSEKTIVLRRNKILMGDVVITGGHSSRPLQGVTGGVRIRGREIKKDTVVKKITGQIRNKISPIQNTAEIFPNPVKRGSTFALSLKLKQTGIYNIQIADAAGRVVLQNQTSILSKEYMEQVQTDSRWSSGVYYINVSDNQNRSISKLSFIVK